ncbi:MAG: ribonuclease P protein component [Flavobacteriaceae bacterium]|nr:ribonuclease P protein component [Flavobacteriaceae bacterium]
MKLKPIKDKKKITALFEKGRVINGKNISIRALEHQDNTPGYVISVPKKNFPLAVNRNLIKRRLRAGLADLSIDNHKLSLFLIYISKEIISGLDLKKELTDLVRDID